MREIEFRGKRLDNGDWICGDLLYHAAIINGAAIQVQLGEFRRGTFYVWPDTVGQFTGLTDKNGVKIFEDDVVSYNGPVHKVVFENRGYSGYFGIVIGDNETWPFGMSVPPNMMEVIGNIHDNPELLKS